MSFWDVFLPSGGRYKGKLGYNTAKRVRASLRAQGVRARIRPRATYRYVIGDTDGLERRLLWSLNAVGKSLNRRVYVRSGFRTYAEQKELFDRYGSPRAARPGTSRHETGLAADCQLDDRDGPNIGTVSVARSAMQQYGLCLPVLGEPWHVERGSLWRS